MSFDGLLLSSPSSLFDDDDASARVRERKQDASHLLRVLILREMDDARCDARERKRGGEWINLSAIDFWVQILLAAVIIFIVSSSSERGFFFRF